MISIVMVVRIRDDQFKKLWTLTLESIQGILNTATEQFELIVIDNGSHSPVYINELKAASSIWGQMYPNMEGIRLLRFDEHVSLSKAWNEGVRQADGDYILVANNDIIYHQTGWEQRMMEVLQDPSRRVGIVGIQHMSWAYFSFVEGSLFMFSSRFKDEFDIQPDNDEKVELFDERFEFICDVDLNKRVQEAGYTTVQVNSPPLQPLYLQHLGHRTINTLASFYDYVGATHEDRVKLCEKWGFDPQIND